MPKMSPEMLDAAVIQLRALFQTAEGVPDYVKSSGETFINDLDKWSDELKAAK